MTNWNHSSRFILLVYLHVWSVKCWRCDGGISWIAWWFGVVKQTSIVTVSIRLLVTGARQHEFNRVYSVMDHLRKSLKTDVCFDMSYLRWLPCPVKILWLVPQVTGHHLVFPFLWLPSSRREREKKSLSSNHEKLLPWESKVFPFFDAEMCLAPPEIGCDMFSH